MNALPGNSKDPHSDHESAAGAIRPEKIGPYRLRERLGVGGMGEVYRAFDERLERHVALKQIRSDHEADPNARRRFRREASLAARLDHPGIVKVHDILVAEGCDWIVMELVEGRSLADLLTATTLSIERVLTYATELADALAAAHEEGIVHRDLKAKNVFVTSAGRLKILDFGLAKQILNAAGDTSISLEGQVMGTPRAMSPEQAMGRKVDLRSDLFSLGSLIYEMVTGTSPFQGASSLETRNRICSEQPPPLCEVVPEIPRALSDLVDRLIEKNPARRPRSAAEVALALGRMKMGCTGTDHAVAETRPRKSSKTAGLHTAGPAPVEVPTVVEQPPPRRPTSERRQLTVVSCELVGAEGSSEALDPEVLFTVMAELGELARVTIEAWEGHVAHLLSHQLVAYFGYPQAHEDDARRAVHAARELIEKCVFSPKLALRAGVHTGPAVVSGVATGVSAGIAAGPAQVALGGTLDQAIGLQRLAEPKEVLIGGITHRLLAETFEVEELGPTRIAGSSEPCAVFRALAPRDGSDFRQSSEVYPPMFARERELELMLDRRRVACEGRGQVIWVSGEAGIGKSRLLAALAQESAEQRWLSIQASSHARDSPFRPILGWLRRVLELDPEAPVNEQLDALETALEGYGLREHRSRAGPAALIAEFLGLPSEGRHPPLGLGPELRKKKTLQTLVDLLLAMARREPVVLAVEDLHWMDPSTLELLSLWISACADAALLLVLTSRPDFVPTWEEPKHLTQLELSRLSRREVEQMLGRLSGGKALPETVREQIFAKTDGVPLFVEELVESLLESGRLIEREERWELVGELEALSVPATLRDLLTARLDRLGTAKAVAQLASVVGREFSHALLAEVSSLPSSEIEAALGRLVDAGLVYRKGFSSRRRYLFKHALIQDAAYDSLLEPRRREHHEQVARVLEEHFAEICEARPDLLGFHWEMARHDARAAPCFQRSGDRSKAVYANQEAAAFYHRALASMRKIEDPQDALRLRQSMLALHEAIGDLMTLERCPEAAQAAYGEVLHLADDPLTRSRMHRKSAKALNTHSRSQEALEELGRAEGILRIPLEEQATELLWREWIAVRIVKLFAHHWAGDLEAMKSVVEELEPIVEEYATPALFVEFYETKIALHLRLDHCHPSASTLSLAETYLKYCEQSSDEQRIADAKSTLGLTFLLRNELDDAQRFLSGAQDHAQQIGEGTVEMVSRAYLSLTLRKKGEVEGARKLSEEILTQDASAQYHGLAHGNLCWVSWKRNRLEEAEGHGLAALSCWEVTPFAFQWTARFPMLAVFLRRDALSQAMPMVDSLLNESQEKIPDPIADLFRESRHSWAAKDRSATTSLLEQAILLAPRYHYL